jgi:prepilin-type N-terminal cleavage/methylation domain-containing protein
MRNDKKITDISAFTLIELAMVIVIMGIVAGGIIGGISILENSKTTKVIADYKKFQVAYDQFIQQYSAVPGDMIDADTIFKPVYGGIVKNGNGDGVIQQTNEAAYVWAHLSLADLIGKKYNVDGRNKAPNNITYLDNIFPVGPYKNSGYTIVNAHENFTENGGDALTQDTTELLALSARYDNSLVYSNSVFYLKFAASGANNSLLTAKEAVIIDKKIDDGLFASGSVTGLQAIAATKECGDFDDNSYFITDAGVTVTGASCIMMFNLEKRSGPQ